MRVFADDAEVMRHALLIARQGLGFVEPNPAVGAVVVTEQREWIAEGFHQQFGQAHAEVNAIAAAGSRCCGADLFVTLEPCSHFGKTPPCSDAVIAAGFRRVVIGCTDPARHRPTSPARGSSRKRQRPDTSELGSQHDPGTGIARLRAAGVEVVVDCCRDEALRLIAPFQMLQTQRRPWVHAKWAMTADGRIATSTGHSRWISGRQSRDYVHQLRGRMDAIITGAGTVRADDPLLTGRGIDGPRRVAARVVMDSDGLSLAENSQLVRTARQTPLLVFVTDRAGSENIGRLQDAGAEVIVCPVEHGAENRVSPRFVVEELGRRQMTNVLLEAGAGILGAFFDSGLVDEVTIFVAPKVIGGAAAFSPIGGRGLTGIPAVPNLGCVQWQASGEDLMLQADVVRD